MGMTGRGRCLARPSVVAFALIAEIDGSSRIGS